MHKSAMITQYLFFIASYPFCEENHGKISAVGMTEKISLIR